MASKTVEDVLFTGIDVRVERVCDSSDALVVEAVSTARPGRCPDCRKQAGCVHSTYKRALNERPLGSGQVIVRLRVRRFFCDRKSCSRKTFVEQVPGLSERHRRSSTGLTGWLRSIAIELGGRPAARLCCRLRLVAGRTLCRSGLVDLRRVYASVFLEHGTRRRLHVAGVTAHPTGQRTVQQARNLAVELGLRLESLRFLIRDRDAKYTESFDAVFAADGIEAVWTVPRAPRMNAHCERVVGTLRREVLDHLLIWDETHSRQVLDAYARHYNCHRRHQARGQLPPLAQEYPAPKTDLTAHRVLRRRVLGGVMNEYGYAA
ncbi:integrase core domain-containing protein [Streptomyces sp. NPDC004227]